MTPIQRAVYAAIVELNGNQFNGWFDPAEIMAFVQIESSFHPNAVRYEPSLNESSYGLMQVLLSTGKEFGHDVSNMDVLADNLFVGMKVLRAYFDQLKSRLGRDPYYEEWCDSYNRGVGGVLHEERLGRDTADDAYVIAWLSAFKYWWRNMGMASVTTQTIKRDVI